MAKQFRTNRRSGKVFPITVNISERNVNGGNGMAPKAPAPRAPVVCRAKAVKRVHRAKVHRAKAVHRAKKPKKERFKGISGYADDRAKGVGGKGSWNDWQSDTANRKARKVRDKQGFLVP